MLVNNSFVNPEHFAIHVELVFKNAQLYNPAESPIHKAAVFLAKLFADRYNQLFEPGMACFLCKITHPLPVAEGEEVQEEVSVEDIERFKTTIRELNQSINGFTSMS